MIQCSSICAWQTVHFQIGCSVGCRSLHTPELPPLSMESKAAMALLSYLPLHPLSHPLVPLLSRSCDHTLLETCHWDCQIWSDSKQCSSKVEQGSLTYTKMLRSVSLYLSCCLVQHCRCATLLLSLPKCLPLDTQLVRYTLKAAPCTSVFLAGLAEWVVSGLSSCM